MIRRVLGALLLLFGCASAAVGALALLASKGALLSTDSPPFADPASHLESSFLKLSFAFMAALGIGKTFRPKRSD